MLTRIVLCLLLTLPAATRADPPAADLGLLQFMTGCWQGDVGVKGERIFEHYSPPLGERIVGTVQTFGQQSKRFFEFIEITAGPDGIVLKPYPEGKPPGVEFPLRVIEPDQAIFENLDHDFPQRITYRLLPNGNLLTQIAGLVKGKAVLEEYQTGPVRCRPEPE